MTQIWLKTLKLLVFLLCYLRFYADCSSCPPGRFDCGGTCCICEFGSYCPGDDNYYECPSGTYANALYFTICQPCPAGTYSGAGSYLVIIVDRVLIQFQVLHPAHLTALQAIMLKARESMFTLSIWDLYWCFWINLII